MNHDNLRSKFSGWSSEPWAPGISGSRIVPTKRLLDGAGRPVPGIERPYWQPSAWLLLLRPWISADSYAHRELAQCRRECDRLNADDARRSDREAFAIKAIASAKPA